MTTVLLDYEARSGVSLPAVGSYRWSDDERFQILMAAVRQRGNNLTPLLWVHPDYRLATEEAEAKEAERLLNSADIIYAHNAPHELANTWGAIKHGEACPLTSCAPLERWRCTAAVARRAGLPSALGTLAHTLELPLDKDSEGKRLIQTFCIPNKKTGAFGDPLMLADEWEAFKSYCRRDLVVEQLILEELKAFELSGELLETFLLDLRLNLRGVPVNRSAIQHAQRAVAETTKSVRARFMALTKIGPNAVVKETVRVEPNTDESDAEDGIAPSRREAVRSWLKGHGGIDLPDMKAATVAAAIESAETPPLTREVLELYQSLSYTAVTKLNRMLQCACSDGRVRGCHLFYGAGTGRWAGKHIQPQNFKKPTKALRKITDSAYVLMQRGASGPMLDELCGPPLEVVASSIRHFIHAPGHEMLQGDYAAIEARIVCWLAGQHDILEAHRKADAGLGPDVYRIMAASIYGGSPYEINDDQRAFGKVVELGCGFGMGRAKFKATAEAWGIPCDDELADLAVTAYRRTHQKVQAYWYLLDNNVREAIRHPGVKFGNALVRRAGKFPYLLLSLPSGRTLSYPRPSLKMLPFSADNPEPTETITYWGPLGKNFLPIKTYGGSLTENCIGEGTEVLTQRGWIAIERVQPDDSVWDGVEWVKHDGVIYQGDQNTMGFAGIYCTPDHGIFESNSKTPAIRACTQAALQFAAASCPVSRII